MHHLLSLKTQNVKDGAILIVENKQEMSWPM